MVLRDDQRYAEGSWVAQDYVAAAQWWEKAAAHGSINGKRNLAQILNVILFPPGTIVQVVGLKNAPHLNGEMGLVDMPAGGGAAAGAATLRTGGAEPAAVGRLPVMLSGGGKVAKSIRWSNLRKVGGNGVPKPKSHISKPKFGSGQVNSTLTSKSTTKHKAD